MTTAGRASTLSRIDIDFLPAGHAARPLAGFFFVGGIILATGPTTKKAAVYFDGQNPFYAAKQAFGYSWPNYDPLKLARAVCGRHGWTLVQTRFYTGVPSVRDDPFWNHFWTAKLAQMGRVGIRTFHRDLRYRNQTVALPNGSSASVLVGSEKGVDIRIALDVVAAAYAREVDVAVIFSQDQDLSEVSGEVRLIAADQGRWFKLASAFPISPTSGNTRGINKTDWLRVDRAEYDACLDPRDYRP